MCLNQDLTLLDHVSKQFSSHSRDNWGNQDWILHGVMKFIIHFPKHDNGISAK
jgi:hypothetical protein